MARAAWLQDLKEEEEEEETTCLSPRFRCQTFRLRRHAVTEHKADAQWDNHHRNLPTDNADMFWLWSSNKRKWKNVLVDVVENDLNIGIKTKPPTKEVHNNKKSWQISLRSGRGGTLQKAEVALCT